MVNRRNRRPEASVLSHDREIAAVDQYWQLAGRPKRRKPPKNYEYIEELAHLQFELIKLQEWVRLQGLKVVVIFEGRDAAGKGGMIKRINPRICRVVALGTPTERERRSSGEGSPFSIASANGRRGSRAKAPSKFY
jgi:polyphosphate kinase